MTGHNDEKELIKKRIKEEKIEKEELQKHNKKEHISKKIKEQKNNKKDLKTSNTQSEFPYIEDVPKTEIGNKHIFIDPGKRTLLTMLDNKGVFYQYFQNQ